MITMYLFKLKFSLCGDTFNSEESILELPTSDKTIDYTLHSKNNDSQLKESKEYIVEGVGFSTEEKAYEAGEKAILALYWYGINSRSGVDQIDLEVLEQKDDLIGVISTVTGGSADLTVIRPVDLFTETFQRGMTLVLDNRLELGVDLYNISHSKGSLLRSPINAQFLTLMFTIETLVNRKEIPRKKVCEYIKCVVKRAKISHLDEPDKGYLTSRLDELKIESIRSAGKRLMKEHLESRQYRGQSAEEFFDKCYEIRSAMVHGRKQPSVGLSEITRELDKMVSDLLISCVTEQNKHLIT